MHTAEMRVCVLNVSVDKFDKILQRLFSDPIRFKMQLVITAL